MWKQGIATSVFFTALLGLSSGQSAWAKPGDLPVDQRIQCPDGADDPVKGTFTIELGITSKGITLKVESGLAQHDPTPALDAVCPTIMPALLEQLLKQAGDVLWQKYVTAGNAERVFELAEKCLRSGQYDAARTAYQQVHRLSPTSRVGRLAIDRLTEIDERLRDAEEQGVPIPRDEESEEAYRDMRDRAIPLGLVEVSY